MSFSMAMYKGFGILYSKDVFFYKKIWDGLLKYFACCDVFVYR